MNIRIISYSIVVAFGVVLLGTVWAGLEGGLPPVPGLPPSTLVAPTNTPPQPNFPPPIPTYTLVVEGTDDLTNQVWETVLKVKGISAKKKSRFYRTKIYPEVM